eukprot:TRINITY_DN4916_c0_g1_i1.p1 TRINITY_DN4916_c0_g1~~TRINITY_DN4916_c0_g1_i1.p1  ORF type:complete len:161 (-),score=28.44 TRINITY_DN4916_c0_g1_i1:93-512(-)
MRPIRHQHQPRLSFAFRNYCVVVPPIPIILKSDLEAKIRDQKQLILIDVREPKEVQASGSIGQAVNIPLGNVEEMLDKPSEVWERELGIKKPEKDDEIIFYCRLGGRSNNACMITQSKGYNNVINYKGSAFEWFHMDKH